MSNSTNLLPAPAAILAGLCILLLAACAGSGQLPAVEPQFGLRVLETVLDEPGTMQRMGLRQQSVAGGIRLELYVEDARQLQALAVEISYDADNWHLQEAESRGLLGDSTELLAHTLDIEAGLLAHGEVQLVGTGARPFTGDGSVASFLFAAGPAGSLRQARALNPAAPAASWDEGSWSLRWPYGNTGDYDQNSEVNIADLTPIGIHFGAAVNDPASAQAMIDGDGNGEINIADITPIGVNYGNSLTGYRIWELASPPDWLGTADTPPLAEVAFADASGSPSLDRLQFAWQYPADPGYRWLRVAAYSGDETGEPTDIIFTYPSLQPLLSLADATGISGSGSAADPFYLEAASNTELHLELQDSTDVSLDALSSYQLSGPAGAVLNANVIELDAAAAGDYLVNATHDGVPSDPWGLYFHVNEPPVAVLTADPSSGHVPFTIELDASQSEDPDGEIVLVEWDFDNDGTYERETGTELTTLRRYESEGDFEAVVRLTDDRGAMAVSAPLAISVLPPNLPPVPVVSADPTSGNTPLLVSFDATASQDPDGTIVSLDWDFDNDGTYELQDSSDYEPQHTYVTPGIYEVVLRLRDDDGAVAFSSPQLINVGGNFPPVAVLRAVPNAGPSPLMVLLDATESTDPDGEIVLVEWDFGGDGEFDQSGTQLTVNRSYTGDGVFHPVVRLTDNNGGVSKSSPATVTVGVQAGSPPLALLSADPQFGPAPLLVSLDGSGSTDPDNDIVLAEFDFENDGSWDAQDTDDFVVTHEYPNDGVYEVLLRITDSYGHRDTSSVLLITVSSGTPPTAFYQAASLSGNAPFDVVVDASGSTDPDGAIALYEWDADGDGIFEFSTTQSSAQFSLIDPGIQEISLRVVDGDGMTDSFSREFNVGFPSLGWNDWSTGIVNPQHAYFAAVGGRPAVAWQSSPGDIYFKRSADTDGHSWPVGGSLVDADLTDYPGGSIRLLDFKVSGGAPLLLSLKGGDAQVDHDMFVSRGLNSDGSAFAPALKIISGPVFRPDRDNQGVFLLASFNGLPAICYGSDQSGGWHHIRALDSQGTSWPAAPQGISGSKASVQPFGSLLQDPAGGAQLFYFSDSSLQTNRDADGNGANWSFREDLFSQADIVRVQAISSSDSVVLLYTVNSEPGTYTCYASHAVSPGFDSWSVPLQVCELSSGQADAQLLVDNGKPVLLVSGNPGSSGGVHYLRSHNAQGSHWSGTLRISSQSAGELRGADIVNGRLTAIHLRSNGSLRLLTRE